MRPFFNQLAEHRLTRRRFIQGLAATGLSLHTLNTARASGIPEDESSASHKDGCTRMEGTGGELLVAQLKASGVEYVFANPGSTEVGFYDALTAASEPRLILGLHEGIVASMAHGYAQVTGKPAYVNVHAIVGTAQLSGQLYNAHRDGIPMVVNAGLVDPTVLCDDVVLAPRPGFEQVDIIKQFTKLSWEVRRSESIPMATRRAFKTASVAPEGPVYVAIADYALTAKARADIVDQTHFEMSTRVRPNTGQADRVARLLLAARDPMLITGPALRRAGAVAEAVELSDLLGVPATDLYGHFISDSGFPTGHPLFYHRKALNAYRSIPTPQPLGRCDLMIGLDPDSFFPEGASPSSSLHPPPGAATVAIGLNPDAIGRTRPVDLPIIADVGETLRDIIQAVRHLASPTRLEAIRNSRYNRIASEIAAFRKQTKRQVMALCGRTPMHPGEVALIVDQALDPDAITVHENFSHDTTSFCSVLSGYGHLGRQRVASSGSSLGWGVGAAIGATIGRPDRQVVLHIGDGAVMFSAAGFWTMARYRVPVLTLVWNNRNYQTVRYNFDLYNGHMARTGQYAGMYLGDPDIDFVKLAGSQGVEGERAATPDTLRAALQRGITVTRADRPYLIEISTGRTGPGADSTWHQRP